jgi:hypothetical protein
VPQPDAGRVGEGKCVYEYEMASEAMTVKKDQVSFKPGLSFA